MSDFDYERRYEYYRPNCNGSGKRDLAVSGCQIRHRMVKSRGYQEPNDAEQEANRKCK
jgi:hypothetical protein